MTLDPWMKWYPADWRAEARLKMVSRAARSLWMDMIGLMHESAEYGKLLIGGVAPTDKQLGAVLGDRPADITKWRTELEGMGVYSRDENGVIYSRRMVRDKAKRDADRVNGRKGGNPKVKPNEEGSVRPGVNPPVKAHMPEARDQKPEKEEFSLRSNSPASPPKAARSKSVLNGHEREFNEFWAAYPKRVDKRDAEKAYAKALGRADAPIILDGAKRYAIKRKDEDHTYTKGPAHWLNADCWLDEAPLAEGNVADPALERALAAEREHKRKHGDIE